MGLPGPLLPAILSPYDQSDERKETRLRDFVLPKLPLVSNPVLDIHGQDLKAQLGRGEHAGRELQNCNSALCRGCSLVSSVHNLQHALGWFTVECEVAGMRISTSKFEAMDFPLCIGS